MSVLCVTYLIPSYREVLLLSTTNTSNYNRFVVFTCLSTVSDGPNEHVLRPAAPTFPTTDEKFIVR